MTESLGGLDEALDLTNNMLASAKDGQWERVSELSNQRVQCLHAFFSTTVELDDALSIAEQVLSLQAMDRQLMVLCDAQREELSKRLHELNDNKRGAAAYLVNR